MEKLFRDIRGVFLSVKTTIVLLFTIALVSIVGTEGWRMFPLWAL